MTAAHAYEAPLPRPPMVEPIDDSSRLDDVMARVPGLLGERYQATPLAGGLTNRNYRIQVTNGRQFVVRLSSEQSALLAIDRGVEFSNSTSAAAAGVAPEVINYSPDLGALVIDWIDGNTFTAEDLDNSATLELVAETCRKLHNGPAFSSDFDMFALQPRYLDLVMTNGYRLPTGYLDYLPHTLTMSDAMAVRDEGTVPCHNDLLAANIMRTDDQLWFIDFEYSGNADPCFELGNLASESHLSESRLTELVAAYFGEATPGKIARAKLFALMSDYGWTLWAAIQDATSELDFDFWSWGMEKYERALSVFHGPDLHHLINDVQQP